MSGGSFANRMIAAANNVGTALVTFAQRAAEFAVFCRGTVAGRVGAFFLLFVSHNDLAQLPSAFHANHCFDARRGLVGSDGAPHFRNIVRLLVNRASAFVGKNAAILPEVGVP